MPDYRLKNGKIVTVKEEDIQSFMSSKLGNGAVLIEEEVKPVKTEAVAKKDAPVTAVNEVIDTGLASVNTSSELQETNERFFGKTPSEDPDPDEPISASKIRVAARNQSKQKRQDKLAAEEIATNNEYQEALLGVDKTLTDAGSSIWSYDPNNISDLYLKTTGKPLEFSAVQSTSFIGGSGVSYGGVFAQLNCLLVL